MVALQLQDLVLWDLVLARVPARTLGLVLAQIMDPVRAAILDLALVALIPAALVLAAPALVVLTREVPVLGDLVLAALTLAALIPEDLVPGALALEGLILGLEGLAAEVLEIQLHPVVALAIQRRAEVVQTFQEVTYTMQPD